MTWCFSRPSAMKRYSPAWATPRVDDGGPSVEVSCSVWRRTILPSDPSALGITGRFGLQDGQDANANSMT